MAVTQTIKIDLNNHKADDIIIRVGESYTRKIVFIPGTYEGDEFKPIEFYGREAGPRALFRLVKPDRTFVMQDLTSVLEEPDTGFYSFELVPDEYMSQVAGIGYYDIRINDSDTEEEFLYTVQGRVLIDDDMITDSMIESVAASNGLIFPDDFLTSAELSNYATKQYVDDAIAALPPSGAVYSLDEHQIGTWIDQKPLYEKTIYVGTLAYGSAWTSYAHNISNIKAVVSCVGVFKNTSDNVYYNIPVMRPSSKLSICVGADTTNIKYMNDWLSTATNCYVTIRYTKTTD